MPCIYDYGCYEIFIYDGIYVATKDGVEILSAACESELLDMIDSL